MKLTIDIAKIPEEEKSELVVLLLEIISQQAETIQELKDEIARLKGGNPRPKIEPSRLEPARKEKPEGGEQKRPGSDKRHKSVELVIHDELKVPAVGVPEGAKFKGLSGELILREVVFEVRWCKAMPVDHCILSYLSSGGMRSIAMLSQFTESHLTSAARPWSEQPSTTGIQRADQSAPSAFFLPDSMTQSRVVRCCQRRHPRPRYSPARNSRVERSSGNVRDWDCQRILPGPTFLGRHGS